jgi:DNA-binding transcriptional ArsR family regulator
MEIVKIYQCFCDETRLRILNLLICGPLCVCHFQELLQEPQVKISKHLAYLRERGLVEARRHQNWMIYYLTTNPSEELTKNLNCLKDCAQSAQLFRDDLIRYEAMKEMRSWIDNLFGCCAKD